MDEILAGLEGAAHAAVNGKEVSEKFKTELEQLSQAEKDSLTTSRVSPLQWAELFLSAINTGKKLKDLIKSMRGLK